MAFLEATDRIEREAVEWDEKENRPKEEVETKNMKTENAAADKAI